MDNSSVYSWFLGPKAENADILERLVLEALRDTVFWRRNFHPEDTSLITERVKRDEAFQDSITVLQQEFSNLLAILKRDIPFFSPRYIGHMLGDQLLPAVLGYFAAMLHNPNNVTQEGGPRTTILELEVADQLARLMGFTGETWGHLTSGGTIANVEALWVARNLKYLAFAARDVLRELQLGSYRVRTPDGGEVDLATDVDPWVLANLDGDEALSLRSGLCDQYIRQTDRESPDEAERYIVTQLAEHSISGKGLQRFFADEPGIKPGVLFAPATAHYSIRKAAEALGLGRGRLALKVIPVDRHFRMDLDSLRHELDVCVQEQTPVIAVVSVLGSTEEGAIDFLHKVVDIRQEFRAKGLTFHHHCDAAWGGYLRTLFFDELGQPVSEQDLRGALWPHADVAKSFMSVAQTDSVTIDPHKLGYIPYPCGAITFRRSDARELIAYDAPYVFTTLGDRDSDGRPLPFIGRYILEGSKPGASAAACWLAHKVVPLHRGGYGEIIGKSIQSAQAFFWNCRYDLKRDLESDGIVFWLLTNPPDTNLVCFMVNKKGNTSLEKMNRLNEAIYDKFRFHSDEVIQRGDFIISNTDFEYEHYGLPTYNVATGTYDGPSCMHEHLAGVGIADQEFRQVGRVKVLRCTIMSPWLALAHEGKPDYIVGFRSALKTEILSAVRQVFGPEAPAA